MKLLHSLAFVAALIKASLLLVNASPLIGPLAGLAPSSPTSNAFPSPDIDPFYRAPASIAHYSPGQVVRTRLTNSTFSKDHLSHSYQVMVRSASTQMLPIGAVATILVPKNVSSKAAPKILSYQYFEDSVSQSCSPSWNYVDTPKPMNTTGGKSANSEAPWYVNWALERGYYVVIPDHEGPNSAFMAGHQGGKIVLDSIRALINHESLPKRKAQIAMFGYSGGAHATAWATIMHESWAPELNIIGAVHGGTPIDPENLLNHLNAGPFSGWAGAGIVGLMHAYPELDKWVHDHLLPNGGGKELLDHAAQPGICIGEFFLEFMFQDYYAKVDMPEPIRQPIPQKVVRGESLLKSKATFNISTPKFPRLIYHAVFDEAIPFNDTAAFVEEQCSSGAQIHFEKLMIAEHALGTLQGIPLALDYLGKLFTGEKLPEVTCGKGQGGDKDGVVADPVKVLGEDLARKWAMSDHRGMLGIGGPPARTHAHAHSH